MKLSFDYNGTLDQEVVENFARECIQNGHEVWIVTSRLSEKHMSEISKPWETNNSNEDLFQTASRLGIPKSQIAFMNYRDKSEFLNGKGFIFHLDDNLDTLLDIDFELDDCLGIDVRQDDWQLRCKKAILKKEMN